MQQRAQMLQHLRKLFAPEALKACRATAGQVQQNANASWHCLKASHEQGFTRQDTAWLRWLATGTLLVAAQSSPSVRADAPDPPNVGSDTTPQQTNNRGGTASTSTSAESLPEPIGNQHTAKWKVYTTLAKKLVAQKKLGEAEQYLQQALAEAKQGFGADDPHVAGACNNLAELYRLKKDFAKAEALYQECVDKMRSSFGNDDIRVGAALHNMAGLYASTDPPQLDRAEAVLTEALAVKRRAVGEKHAEYVQSLVSLAELKQRQGQPEQALLLFKQAAEVLRNQDPSFSAGNVLQYTQLASVLVGAGQLGEAEALLHQLLLHVETIKGSEHVDVSLICQEMAVLMQRTNRLPEARDLLQRGLDIRAARYKNAQHPGLVDPLLALAAVELKQTDSASWQRAYNIAGRARDVVRANKAPLDRRFGASPKTDWTTSLLSYFSFSPSPVLDPQDQSKFTLAFLLSSAKLALALRLMSLAEKQLDRREEAEQTLVEAMQLFKAPALKTCLEALYAESDNALEADLGSAVSDQVKASVVKRVMEAYSACSIQLAIFLRNSYLRESTNESSQKDALELALLNKAANTLSERGNAAHDAATKDVLASKWIPS